MPDNDTCSLTINLFDGSRQRLSADIETLVTVRNGNQKIVLRDSFNANKIDVPDLEFFDNDGDNYTVIVSADGYEQAGFTPIPATPKSPGEIDIMLLKKDGDFNFSQALWDMLDDDSPAKKLLAAGVSAGDAKTRYDDLRENQGAVLACYFNLTTAMEEIQLPQLTPMDYIKELIWEKMAQDRFFAWADPALVEQVRKAAKQKAFAPEVGTAIFHDGATSSFKQVQFGEANVQLTFHENDKKTIDGLECIMVEPDVDYFKDLGAHALLEVIANKLSGNLTDPRQVYVLRWMAGMHARIPPFEPPYTIS
jgi:hypothetical protein